LFSNISCFPVAVVSISPVFPILSTRELFGMPFYRSVFSPFLALWGLPWRWPCLSSASFSITALWLLKSGWHSIFYVLRTACRSKTRKTSSIQFWAALSFLLKFFFSWWLCLLELPVLLNLIRWFRIIFVPSRAKSDEIDSWP
jgi:hypothetical protein